MDILVALLSLVGFILLTAGTAFFVAVEFSVSALEKTTVDSALREGDRRSRMVKTAHQTLSFQLSGAQLGITITTLITGFLAEPVLGKFFQSLLGMIPGLSESVVSGVSLVVALFLATSFSMIFGELVPKNWAISEPMRVARLSAPVSIAFSTALAPFIRGLNGAANRGVRAFGLEPIDELESARSAAELGALVTSSAREGSLPADTAQVVSRSLTFGDMSAEDLMTPRSTIETLDAEDTVLDLLERAQQTGHSRFPVTSGDLDSTVGIVHVKQAFLTPAANRPTTTVRSLAEPVISLPTTLDGDSVLDRVRSAGLQVALVIDEYGGTAGIVTMEDVVEEIVGDVRDEHDSKSLELRRLDNGWSCAGLLRADEIERGAGIRFPENTEVETLGGLVMEALGRIPQRGDEVLLPASADNLALTTEVSAPRWMARVTAMDGRRVDRVVLTPLAYEEAARRFGKEVSDV